MSGGLAIGRTLGAGERPPAADSVLPPRSGGTQKTPQRENTTASPSRDRYPTRLLR